MQLCVWSIDGWEKKKSRFIQAPAGRASPLVGDTKVQFHNDQAHLLVVHESQIAIYDSKLDSLRSWSPRDALPASISSAIFSCDGLLVYAAFVDGAVGVFEADSLRLRCRIAPSAYIPKYTSFFSGELQFDDDDELHCDNFLLSLQSSISSGSAYPIVIAAHPSEPYQIALGMSDGAVHVVEPSDSDMKWGSTAPSQDSGAPPTTSSTPAQNSSQASEPPSR